MGLLTNYRPVVAERPQIIEYQNPRKYLSDKPVDYASCQWKVNVVLSTNHLSKVLRPEIILEIQTQQGEKVKMTLSQEKFEELRR